METKVQINDDEIGRRVVWSESDLAALTQARALLIAAKLAMLGDTAATLRLSRAVASLSDVAGGIVGVPRVEVAEDDAPPPMPETLAAAQLRLVLDVGAAQLAVEESQGALTRRVQDARERGVSWTRIGGALGVTKQSARARFQKRSISGSGS